MSVETVGLEPVRERGTQSSELESALIDVKRLSAEVEQRIRQITHHLLGRYMESNPPEEVPDPEGLIDKFEHMTCDARRSLEFTQEILCQLETEFVVDQVSTKTTDPAL